MNVKGFNHLTLCISNLEKSIDFYCNVLGMKLIHKGRTDVYLEWGNAWICLLEKKDYLRKDYFLGMDHVAFSIDDEGFNRAIHTLREHDIAFVREPVKRGGGLSLQFEDPDGIILELTTDTLKKRMKNWK